MIWPVLQFVTLTLTGAQIKTLLEQQWLNQPKPRVLQVSKGFSYTWDDRRPRGDFVAAEGITPRGQMVYNTGVIFATPHRPDVRAVFDQTLSLAQKYQDKVWNEQPYFSLAMETLNFNPYTLSPSFNHRGFGELISGSIRIWHSYEPLPKNADVESTK